MYTNLGLKVGLVSAINLHNQRIIAKTLSVPFSIRMVIVYPDDFCTGYVGQSLLPLV